MPLKSAIFVDKEPGANQNTPTTTQQGCTMKKLVFCILFSLCLFSLGAQTLSLDDAIASSAKKIGESLEKGTRVAVLNCTSSSPKLAVYVLQELVFALVNSGRLVVVEREDLALVKDELQFQISGDVSDESAQSIGKILGAEVIISASFDETFHLRVKAIAVESARLLAVTSTAVEKTGKAEVLSANLVLVLDCSVTGAEASLGSTLSGLMVSAVSGAPGFRAVSNESRQKALGEVKTSLADLADEGTRARLGKVTEAATILLGKLSLEGGLWFFTVSHVSVATGSILSSSTENYRSPGTLLEGASGQILRCLGVQRAADDRRVITVSNMTELLQSIGSDRIIKLLPGEYDLTEGYQVKNKYVTWVDEYDGPCPVIKSVSNLALIGEGDATIMIKPAYGWVFSFDTCTGIRLSSLILGHTVPGTCLGGVLRFKNCDDTEIRSCELYGSGTYGLGLERATGFIMEDCIVRDCTYGLATIERSSGLTFIDTVFRETGEYDLISVSSSDHMLWSGCRFEDNWGPSLFYVDDESRDLRLTGCAFTGNRVASFCNKKGSLDVEGAVYKGNQFKPYGK